MEMEMEKKIWLSVKSARSETKKNVVDLSKALPKMKERSMKRDWRKIVEINHTPADSKAMMARLRMRKRMYREYNFRYKMGINDPTLTYSQARRRSGGEYYPILCSSGQIPRERIMEEKLLVEKCLAIIARGREAFLPSSLKQDNNSHVVDHDEVI